MEHNMTELQKLRGVGDVLARRFIEAGYDSLATVAAAGVEEIGNIKGVNPRMAGSIVNQAVEMTTAPGERRDRIEELKQRAAGVKQRVQELAIRVRDRFLEDPAGPATRKVERELVRFIASLEKVEGKLESRPRKAGKGLAKAEKRLAALAGSGIKGINRGLKKARKSLKRVYV